jgi:hypothetical protein
MAAGQTYTPILNYTLPSDTATVTLGSGGQGTIPATYTDLVAVISGTMVSGTGTSNLKLQFNGVTTGTGYRTTRMLGMASGVDSSDSGSIAYIMMADTNGDNQFGVTINIPQYSNTTTYKSAFSRGGTAISSAFYHGLYVGTWSNTAAIYSLTFAHNVGSFKSGTKFSLYGIQAA